MPPMYEFHCNVCNEEFESLIRPWDKEPLECPKCKTRESHEHSNGKITKKVSVTAKHVWGCSSEGAMPSKGR